MAKSLLSNCLIPSKFHDNVLFKKSLSSVLGIRNTCQGLKHFVDDTPLLMKSQPQEISGPNYINHSAISPFFNQFLFTASLKDEILSYIFNYCDNARRQYRLSSETAYANAVRNLQIKVIQNVMRSLPLILEEYSEHSKSLIQSTDSIETWKKKIKEQTCKTVSIFVKSLISLRTSLLSHILLISHSPRNFSDTIGSKGGSPSKKACPDSNSKPSDLQAPKMDRKIDKSTSPDSGAESTKASSSPSPPSSPTLSDSSLEINEVPEFPEDVLWQPLPDDLEAAFEEEMSESKRMQDERWYPHRKQQSPEGIKYYPKVFYEEITTFEPSTEAEVPAPSTVSAFSHGSKPKFQVYEDPNEPESSSNNHNWSQVSYDEPSSHSLNSTRSSQIGSSMNLSRPTSVVRRRLEFDSPNSAGHSQPVSSTPKLESRFEASFPAGSVKRRLYNESSESEVSPSLSTSKQSISRNVSAYGRNPSTFTRGNIESISFSSGSVASLDPGQPFVFSSDDDPGLSDVSRAQQTFITCPDPETCVEEIREMRVFKRSVPNDGSYPVGKPVLRSQFVRRVSIGDSTNQKGSCSQSSSITRKETTSSTAHIDPCNPCGKKKTSINNFNLHASLPENLSPSFIAIIHRSVTLRYLYFFLRLLQSHSFHHALIFFSFYQNLLLNDYVVLKSVHKITFFITPS